MIKIKIHKTVHTSLWSNTEMNRKGVTDYYDLWEESSENVYHMKFSIIRQTFPIGETINSGFN